MRNEALIPTSKEQRAENDANVRASWAKSGIELTLCRGRSGRDGVMVQRTRAKKKAQRPDRGMRVRVQMQMPSGLRASTQSRERFDGQVRREAVQDVNNQGIKGGSVYGLWSAESLGASAFLLLLLGVDGNG